MNNLITYIARTTDSMLLVASMDHSFELEEYKSSAKKILKNIKPSSPAKCTIAAGAMLYHYYIEDAVVYLALCERSYPKRLAFTYLEELQRAFAQQYGQEVHRFSRPYAAVEFDPQMQRLRKQYLDPRSPQNMDKINDNLNDIHNIMVQNIQEVLHRGETLDNMQTKSYALLNESKKFDKYARYVNLLSQYKAAAPFLALALLVILVIWFRFF